MAERSIAALKPWQDDEREDRGDRMATSRLVETLIDAGYTLEKHEPDNPLRPLDRPFYVVREVDEE